MEMNTLLEKWVTFEDDGVHLKDDAPQEAVDLFKAHFSPAEDEDGKITLVD